MDAWLRVEHGEIDAALYHLLAFGNNMAPAMGEIAAVGEATTRLRFRTETGPDGQRWKPSLRVQLHGGRTLTKDGHLSGSISANHGKDFAEWGMNRVYAAIHQFGGVIRPRSGGSLRFRLANGAFVSAKTVSIPARPSLGVNDDDTDDILDVLERRIRTTNSAITGELNARRS
jgi:phage virion morphogenesis protein